MDHEMAYDVEDDGTWKCVVTIPEDQTVFYRVVITGPSQTIVKETALSLVKANISRRG